MFGMENNVKTVPVMRITHKKTNNVFIAQEIKLLMLKHKHAFRKRPKRFRLIPVNDLSEL
mgnify:FL=1